MRMAATAMSPDSTGDTETEVTGYARHDETVTQTNMKKDPGTMTVIDDDVMNVMLLGKNDRKRRKRSRLFPSPQSL